MIFIRNNSRDLLSLCFQGVYSAWTEAVREKTCVWDQRCSINLPYSPFSPTRVRESKSNRSETLIQKVKQPPLQTTQPKHFEHKMGYLFRRDRRHSVFQASNNSKNAESDELLAEKLLDYAQEPSRDIRRSDPTAATHAKENHEAESAAQGRRHTVSHQSVRDGWQHFEWPTGDKYDGNIKNKKKHGFGIMKWSNGGNGDLQVLC